VTSLFVGEGGKKYSAEKKKGTSFAFTRIREKKEKTAANASCKRPEGRRGKENQFQKGVERSCGAVSCVTKERDRQGKNARKEDNEKKIVRKKAC